MNGGMKFGGGRPAQPVPPGTAPLTSPIPRPRPAIEDGTTQPKPARGKLVDFFGGVGSESRHNRVMDMLSAAMSSAQGGSPLANFLAPLLGGAIGAREEKRYGDARSSAAADQARAVYGPLADDPKTQALFGVLNDPNSPDYLRSQAKSQLDAMAKAMGGGGSSGGGRRSSGGGSSGGGSSTSGERLYGQTVIDGVVYGATRDGRMLPYKMPDGSLASTNPSAAPDAPQVMSTSPAMPQPGGLTEDDLKYLGVS